MAIHLSGQPQRWAVYVRWQAPRAEARDAQHSFETLRHAAAERWAGDLFAARSALHLPLRRGGHASASVASCRPTGAQGNRLPARSSILRDRPEPPAG
jgi:hypothetical protein